MLRFTYAYVQIMLYRPFLHYASSRLTAGETVDKCSYACAAAAIRVSRNSVHIGRLIREQGLRIGPYWFILYAQFLATQVLLFCAVEYRDQPGSYEILLDTMTGRDNVASLAGVSVVAERFCHTLDV